MSSPRNVHVIACGVLAVDIRRTAERLGIDITEHYLPGGLHESPNRLREELQAAIDRASDDGRCDRIAVGYGVCGRGSVGIHARGVELAIPRVHDCIAMFLGSDAEYRRQFARYPGTYYISTGWFLEKVEPISQTQCKTPDGPAASDDKRLAPLTDKYGRDNAEAIVHFMDSWKRNYQRAAFIDTGAGDEHPDYRRHAEYARDMAEQCGWEYEEVPGDLTLIEKMLTAEASGDEVLIVPPGYVTEYDAVDGGLTARPVSQRGGGVGGVNELSTSGPDPSPAGGEGVHVGLGIDAGGTYTDAVIYDFDARRALDKAKALTTRWDFTEGINEALAALDADWLRRVNLVSVSTTLATNAIVEGYGQKVGLLVMPPYGLYSPGDVPHSPTTPIRGRLDITGEELEPIDAAQVAAVAEEMAARHGVKAFAISGFAGAVNPAHELAVKEIVRERTGLDVTCGHELSSLLNFRVRAHTAVLNARIIPRLAQFLRDVRRSLTARGLAAPIMVVKGDGSLMSTEVALTRPVETILSGPAASVAGARRLTGLDDAVVTDIGGTTTDTASLAGGMVRVCDDGTVIGGRHTHVRALQVRTFGLGGDSLISRDDDGEVTIGPDRVAPVAWVGAHSSDAGEALTYLEHQVDHCDGETRPMELYALTAHHDGLEPDELEREVLELLARRPHSALELADRIGLGHWQLLRTRRLTDASVVQRCGLTPTDLLHATGRFVRWDADAARRMCRLHARLAGADAEKMIDELLGKVIRKLAVELIKKQFADRFDPDAMDDCPGCEAMLDALLAGGAEGLTLTATLDRPIVGIGAPVGHFLPRAAEMLGAECVIPDNADVANAVGAITSNVSLSRRVEIRPDEEGLYAVDGLPGARSFETLAAAQGYAVTTLREAISRDGRTAGAGTSSLQILSEDRITRAADGTEVFLGRAIVARLTGRPDVATAAEHMAL